MPLQSGHGVLLVVFAVVLVAPRVGRLVKVPDLVGLTVGGVVVGPFGLGLIQRTGTVEALGTAGLLYLMFQAGLELEQDDFNAHRKSAAVFGVLTFAIPFSLGAVAHGLLGFDLLAALLLASCWASHTLLTYPMFQEAGATSNRAVSIGVAGTVLTDTAALLTLVVLARAHEGEMSFGVLALQVPILIASATLILFGLPILAGWFFAGIGRDRPTRFLFVMISLFGSALLAEAAGVEAIIGAFLAGLAMNRSIVEGSELDRSIRQFGSAFLVPIFLVSVGMLVDPAAALTEPRSLLLAAAFTAIVVAGKSVAAAVTSRLHGLSPAERMTLIALSVPQAAATLAAVFVGFEIGLIEQATVDAVIVVILLTCLLGTVAAKRALDRLDPAPVRSVRLGKRILVPLPPAEANAAALELAAAIGRRDNGTVHPLSVLGLEATNAEVTALRNHLIATAEQTALRHHCEAQSIVRLDLTPAIGLIHAAVETDATMILLSWDGRRTGKSDRFSHTVDTLLDLSPTPIVVTSAISLDHYRRVVLRIDPEGLTGQQLASAELAWAVGTKLSAHLKVPLILATQASPDELTDYSAITSHVSEIHYLKAESPETPHQTDDLVIRILGHRPIGDSENLWVAAPRSTEPRVLGVTSGDPMVHPMT